MNISIFGYLSLPEDKYWYYSKINNATAYGMGVAPEMTSVSGGFCQTYYKLSFNEFKDKRLLLSDDIV